MLLQPMRCPDDPTPPSRFADLTRGPGDCNRGLRSGRRPHVGWLPTAVPSGTSMAPTWRRQKRGDWPCGPWEFP